MTDETAKDGRTDDAGMVPRFHAAHPPLIDTRSRTLEPAREVLLAVAGKQEGHASEQLQQQAAELAQHLHSRQRDLARWEAALNARSAVHDDEQRSIRLWEREQQQDFAAREAELERRQAGLDRREAELEFNGATAAALATQREQLVLRQQQLDRLERDLQEQTEHLQAEAAELERQRRRHVAHLQLGQQTLEQERHQLQADSAATQALHAQLHDRLEELHQAADERVRYQALSAELQRWQAVLQERERWLIRDRHAWEQEKECWQRRTLRQRQAIAQSWRTRRQTLQLQLKALGERREQLTQHQETLDLRHTELRHEQRELLEQRLALQLARDGLISTPSPAQLAALRQCLREHVDAQRIALEATHQQQRRELQHLAATLARQQESLTSRQEAIQRWTREEQRQFDAQAAELETREQDLERLHQQLLSDKQAWLITLDQALTTTITKTITKTSRESL
ncbi:MAG: hypothetical protein ACYC0X_18175 [Pirellulaceae bacterium]